jgi:predicted RNA-binding Zn-ribbon protein involved in translation (DUF1610 family)
MSAFFDWKASQVSCAKCGWQGLGRDAEMGDSFAEGAEYHCPKCFHYFGFKAWPMSHEFEKAPLRVH